MKRFLSILLALVFLLPAFLCVNAETGGADIAQKKLTGKTLSDVIRLTLLMYSKKHYVGGDFDGKRSKMAYDFYLRMLDPSRIYLLDQEISSYDFSSDFWVKSTTNGDYSIILSLHKIVLKRHEEYIAYAKELFATPQDTLLHSNDKMLAERKDAPRPKTKEEMKALWRQYVINSLIIETLSDKSAKEKYEEAKKKEAEGKWDKDEVFPELPQRKPTERILRRLEQMIRYMRERDDVEVVSLFLNAVGMTYDPHTNYFAPIANEDFNIGMSLKLTGIGATLTQEDGYTKIISLVPGGPAEKSGKLGVGDRITEVAQEGKSSEDVVGMPLSKVVQRIRGPIDTKVTLSVLKAKDGLNGVPQKITIVRKEIQVQDSRASGHVYEMPNSNGKIRKLGVIDMPSFYLDYEGWRNGDPDAACLSRDVAKILSDFEKQGVDGVLCDMRGNGGGSLQDSVNVAGLFTGHGPVVQVQEPSDPIFGSERKKEVLNYEKDAQYSGPVVVLQDKNSASASEIFAAALQDCGRAIIVGGKKSHGKGSVQTMTDLERPLRILSGKTIDAGTLKITIAKFYRISGGSTQFKGVIPDIVLPSLLDEMELGEDKLDNPLPYDAITPAKYNLSPNAAVLMTKIPTLRLASAERIAKSSDFIALKKLIELYKVYRDRKTISLNLEKRTQEEQENKKVQDEITKILEASYDRGQSRDKKKDKYDLRNDPVLAETLNILNGLIDK